MATAGHTGHPRRRPARRAARHDPALPHVLGDLRRRTESAPRRDHGRGTFVMPGQAAELVFDGATKVYGDGAPAVDELSLTVPAGEICVLVGPSGGGKTTALKLVNRLIELTSGDIRIEGQSIKTLDVTELRRGIGYVIQQVGLFPHLTIEANIGTVPRLSAATAAGFAAVRRSSWSSSGSIPRTRLATPRSFRAES